MNSISLPQKRYECKSCKSIISIGREEDEKKIQCCKEPNLMLLSTEFTNEEYSKINLENLHRIYKENLYIEDTDRIDVVLAVALSYKLEGIPLWLILVGPSGDMKSVQLNAIDGSDVFVLHNLTSKTLVNGYKDKKEYPDLAPELDNKIVVIPDMAQILKLHPAEKAEVWAQLRDLYDGLAGKVSGQGVRARYDDLKVTLLAASTPVIDGQILVHQDLGTRELIYRTTGNENKDKVMRKCFENEETEEDIKNRLQRVTMDFLRKTEIKRIVPEEEIMEDIQRLAIFISYMRSTAEFDNYTHELRNYVYPEEPTRIAKQLKRIYICLKSLSEDYSDLTAMRILWHLGKSSAFPIRIKVFELMKNTEGELSTSQISQMLKIGKATAKRECLVMENIGVFNCRRQETSYPDRFYEYWSFNRKKKHLIQESKFVLNRLGRSGEGG